MSSENDAKEDWFDWAESFLTDRKARETEWNESFSPRAERVLELATQAALSLHHDAVGVEHLLSGLLKLNSGAAAVALKDAGLNLALLRAEIDAERGKDREREISRPIPWTPRSKGIIQRSRDAVRASGQLYVEPENLLWELLTEKEGLTARIFRKRAIDVEKIKNAIIKANHRETNEPEQPLHPTGGALAAGAPAAPPPGAAGR